MISPSLLLLALAFPALAIGSPQKKRDSPLQEHCSIPLPAELTPSGHCVPAPVEVAQFCGIRSRIVPPAGNHSLADIRQLVPWESLDSGCSSALHQMLCAHFARPCTPLGPADRWAEQWALFPVSMCHRVSEQCPREMLPPDWALLRCQQRSLRHFYRRLKNTTADKEELEMRKEALFREDEFCSTLPEWMNDLRHRMGRIGRSERPFPLLKAAINLCLLAIACSAFLRLCSSNDWCSLLAHFFIAAYLLVNAAQESQHSDNRVICTVSAALCQFCTTCACGTALLQRLQIANGQLRLLLALFLPHALLFTALSAAVAELLPVCRFSFANMSAATMSIVCAAVLGELLLVSSVQFALILRQRRAEVLDAEVEALYEEVRTPSSPSTIKCCESELFGKTFLRWRSRPGNKSKVPKGGFRAQLGKTLQILWVPLLAELATEYALHGLFSFVRMEVLSNSRCLLSASTTGSGHSSICSPAWNLNDSFALFAGKTLFPVLFPIALRIWTLAVKKGGI